MKSIKDTMGWNVLVGFHTNMVIVFNIVVTIIVALACILRYVFQTDLNAYEEYLILIAWWLYMMGGAHGSYEKSHITADILSVYLKEGKLKDIISIIKYVLLTCISIVVVIWAFQYASFSIELGKKTPVYQIPRVLGEIAILIGFLMMTFYNAVYTYYEIIGFLRKSRRNQSFEGGV